MIRKSHGLWGFIIVSVYYCVVIAIIDSLFAYLSITTTIKIATIINVNIRIVFLVINILTITYIITI